MPHPPNDNEKPQPAAKPNKSRRARHTITPFRPNPIATYGKLFAQCPKGHPQLTEMLIKFKPRKMVRFLIQSVLDDSLTKEELKAICAWYRDVLTYWHMWED